METVETGHTREQGSGALNEKNRHDLIRQFMKELFGGKPDATYILVWQLDGKRSYWFTEVEAAVATVMSLADEDAYVGFGLSPKDFGPGKRCKAEYVVGMIGVVADLDVLGPAHKKQNLPPTIEDALSLLPANLPPTVIVHSGHGIQAWWLFKVPWMFEAGQERIAAAEFAQRFNLLLKAQANLRGWDVDSTFDLAHVYRIPGTMNCKPDLQPCLVTIQSRSGQRYNPADIAEFLNAVEAPWPSKRRNSRPAVSGEEFVAGNFVLKPAAEPPPRKFRVLIEGEPRFAEAWEHRRSDFQDQSPSVYDMSLAYYAAVCGWSDQEIVDLLIAHRRKHGADLKLRHDYYSLTISKARKSAAEYWKDEDPDDFFDTTPVEETFPSEVPINLNLKDTEAAHMNSNPGEERHGPDGSVTETTAKQEPPSGEEKTNNAGKQSDSDKPALLALLTNKLRIQIVRVIKFSGDSPQYRIETPQGGAQLGDVDGLINQRKLRKSLAEVTGRLMRHFESEKWPRIAQLLLDCCEIIDRGEDATLRGMLFHQLQTYLSEHPPRPTIQDGDAGREPFVDKGRVHIYLQSFRDWLRISLSEHIPQNTLTADLRAIGAAPEKFHVEIDGENTSRSAWVLPIGPWDSEEL